MSRKIRLVTVILLLKIIILRSFLFSEPPNLYSSLLELASVTALIGLIQLCKPETPHLSWIANFLLSAYFLACVMYYSHFGRLLSFDALLQAGMIKEVGPSILDLFSPFYLIFFLDFFLFFIQGIFRHIFIRASGREVYRSPSAHRYNAIFLFTFLALTLSIFSIWNYPMKENRVSMTRDIGILNSQGYEIFSYLFNNRNTSLQTSEIQQSGIHEIKQIKPVLWPKYFGTASNKNLILIQLESTENFLVGLSVNNQEITPNLNQLMKESLYFPNFYSQIGRGNTSDAEFISNTSLYPSENEIISESSKDTEYPSLPRLLKKKNYTAVTFHPNEITFWCRHYLYPALGFDQYYDKEYYQDQDLLGRWGSSDEVLFQKALPVLMDLQKNKQRFYASIITLTNHHPYILPENKKRLNLPEQLKGTFVGNYLTSANYQDYALGQFIQDLKVNHLWEHSVLVVYGDHFGISKFQETQHRDFFIPLLGRAHDAIDGLNVPLVIRVPGLKPQIIHTPGGQIDLLPTLANLFGLPLNQIAFGQDILNYNQNLLGFRYYYPDGTFINNDFLHIPGNNNDLRIENHRIVQYQKSSLEEEQRIKALMELSDSYVQSLQKQKNDITFQLLDLK